MPKLNRPWLWRPITLLVLPHRSARTYRLRLPALVLAVAATGWIACLGVSAWLITRNIHFEAMKLLNAYLTEQNRLYTEEVAKLEGLADRLAPLEKELTKQLKLTRRAAKGGVGHGGSDADRHRHAPFLPEEIPERVNDLVEVGERLFRDYRTLASLASATPVGWPVRGWITSDYGERISPVTGEVGSLHQGVDIANKTGAPILATADGLVIHAGWTRGGYGKLVEVSHGYGYATLYGHCSRVKVSAGQRVSKGDTLGYLGATGNATGPHLHYEVRLYGIPVSPWPFMK